MKKRNLIILIILIFFGCNGKKETVFSGKTMGTTYNIKIVSKKDLKNKKDLKQGIDSLLKEINKSMSLYDPLSELSKFNQIHENKKLVVTDKFIDVLKAGKDIFFYTGGAWDATAGKLIDTWGFGKRTKSLKIPSDKEIKEILEKTGFEKIVFNKETKEVLKTKNGVSLNFGSIAKGYGVDLVAGFLKENGFKNFMVEIGGEVYVYGKNINNEKWKIGINRPEKNAAQYEITEIINISDAAVATSGTYRNFINIDGKEYSHIIDPKTGKPVKNRVVSVSVVSKSTCFADGLATGMLVMGTKKSLSLCNSLKNTECMIIEKKDDYEKYFSKGFKSLIN